MIPDWGLVLILAGILGGMMAMYETCRFGLVEEMIGKKRWTGTNWRGLILGSTIGAMLFVFAVQVAIAILKRFGATI